AHVLQVVGGREDPLGTRGDELVVQAGEVPEHGNGAALVQAVVVPALRHALAGLGTLRVPVALDDRHPLGVPGQRDGREQARDAPSDHHGVSRAATDPPRVAHGPLPTPGCPLCPILGPAGGGRKESGRQCSAPAGVPGSTTWPRAPASAVRTTISRARASASSGRCGAPPSVSADPAGSAPTSSVVRGTCTKPERTPGREARACWRA